MGIKSTTGVIFKLQCISDDVAIKGLLTKNKIYTAVSRTALDDYLIKGDDKGLNALYKCEFFRVIGITHKNIYIKINNDLI